MLKVMCINDNWQTTSVRERDKPAPEFGEEATIIREVAGGNGFYYQLAGYDNKSGFSADHFVVQDTGLCEIEMDGNSKKLPYGYMAIGAVIGAIVVYSIVKTFSK